MTLIPTSSRVGRCLLVGGGNRQLNAALHRMALNQTTMTDLAVLSSTAASPWQRQDGGLRAWKHSLARIVFKALHAARQHTSTASRPQRDIEATQGVPELIVDPNDQRARGSEPGPLDHRSVPAAESETTWHVMTAPDWL